MKDVIEFLLSEVAGFSVKALYLDKQFYTIDVINYLQGTKKLPFIIPCALRGKSEGMR